MIAMAQEATDDAIHHLDFVLSLNQEIQEDKELLAIANFWKGRCLRMKGEYDDSLAFAIKGRDLATELGHEPMAAVMRVLESCCISKRVQSERYRFFMRRKRHSAERTTISPWAISNRLMGGSPVARDVINMRSNISQLQFITIANGTHVIATSRVP
jgi:hypothetical protein